MKKLEALRSRLNALLRRRAMARTGLALGAMVLFACVVLAGAFALDWTFRLSWLQRLVMLSLYGVAAVWAFRKYAWPLLKVREHEMDVALLVERHQKIDSDLVAALQFEKAGAAVSGSPALAGAVVDYVADFSKSWNVFDGFDLRPMIRRGAIAALVLAALVVLCGLFPASAAAFFNRLFLGRLHYPTQTVVETFKVGNRSVDVASPESGARMAYGAALPFTVECSGDLPPAGRIDLESALTGVRTSVELVREELTDGKARYVGQLPKVLESLQYALVIGDAYTDPASLGVAPLPVVDTSLVAHAPSYAAQAAAEEPAAPNALQISVIEGSSVDLSVTCRNKKLKSAVVTIDNKPYKLTESATASVETGDPPVVWRLTAQSPLSSAVAPVNFSIQVVDEDDQNLERPLRGAIRIKADQRPRITAEMVTRFVLPTASPVVEFRASDDFGLAKVQAKVQAIRDGRPLSAERTFDAVPFKEPVTAEKLPLEASFSLPIAEFGVKKGDEVRVVLEAVDYRGKNPGVAAESEPLLLQVTDESGILAAVAESDERLAKQMESVINRQIGVGDTK